MGFEYIKQYYNVPTCLGRRVTVNGKHGIIAKDCGHYIGVNFDTDKPGVISHCHPTWEVKYGDMGKVRKPSKYVARYQRYLEYGDGFNSFIDFCRWDADPDRSWNNA